MHQQPPASSLMCQLVPKVATGGSLVKPSSSPEPCIRTLYVVNSAIFMCETDGSATTHRKQRRKWLALTITKVKKTVRFPVNFGLLVPTDSRLRPPFAKADLGTNSGVVVRQYGIFMALKISIKLPAFVRRPLIPGLWYLNF